MSKIEVESRALLSSAERATMLDHMRTLGAIRKIHRVSIDFSGEDRTRSVMLRFNNGMPELIAKSGTLTDGIRQEAPLPLAQGVSLEHCLEYMAIMGYRDAMVCLRKMFVTKTSDFEYSLRDVLAYDTHARVSTLFDLEALGVIKGKEHLAHQETRQALDALGVTPLSDRAWEQWVKETHEHADQPFHYSPANVRALVASLEKSGMLTAATAS